MTTTSNFARTFKRITLLALLLALVGTVFYFGTKPLPAPTQPVSVTIPTQQLLSTDQ